MKNLTLTAKNLRYILTFVLVIMFAGSGAGFYFMQQQLRTFANETSQLNSQVAASEQNLNNLKKLKAYLASHQDDEDLAKKVVADTKNYQNDVLDEISTFAAESHVTVLSYTFENSTTTPGGTAPATSAPATGTTGTPPVASTVGGLKENTFTVAISSPVNYHNLLSFISRIEQNVTRMQITSVSLTKDSASNSRVSTDSFEIGVYVK